MRIHTFRNIAKSLLAIYVLCTVFVFTNIAHSHEPPCGFEERAVERRETQVEFAKGYLEKVQDKGYFSSMVSESQYGMIACAIIGAAGGAIVGGISGGPAGVAVGFVVGAAGGGIVGGITGLVSGAMNHRDELNDAEAALEKAERRLRVAKEELAVCEIRTIQYTYLYLHILRQLLGIR